MTSGSGFGGSQQVYTRDCNQWRLIYYDLRFEIFNFWLKLVENLKNTDIFLKIWQPGRASIKIRTCPYKYGRLVTTYAI